MSTPLVPPIPARLADRPTLGGLVVPYITVQTNTGRAYLGQVHGRKMVECVTKGLCQACGQPLSRPMVLFVDAGKLANRFSAEPPLHPECAAYSARACPMLAGQMTHFRRSESPHLRDSCDQPGCDCGGWVVNADSGEAGRPAPTWVAVWVIDYSIAVNDAQEVQGVVWVGEPLRVRPVVARPPATPAAPDVEQGPVGPSTAGTPRTLSR